MQNRHKVFYQGKNLSVTELVNDPELNPLGLKYNCVYGRLDDGWPVEKAMNTPVKQVNKTGRREKPVQIDTKGVHPAIRHEMLYGNSNSFLRACEKFGRG